VAAAGATIAPMLLLCLFGRRTYVIPIRSLGKDIFSVSSTTRNILDKPMLPAKKPSSNNTFARAAAKLPERPGSTSSAVRINTTKSACCATSASESNTFLRGEKLIQFVTLADGSNWRASSRVISMLLAELAKNTVGRVIDGPFMSKMLFLKLNKTQSDWFASSIFVPKRGRESGVNALPLANSSRKPIDGKAAKPAPLRSFASFAVNPAFSPPATPAADNTLYCRQPLPPRRGRLFHSPSRRSERRPGACNSSSWDSNAALP
jgi:hypothetical protein